MQKIPKKLHHVLRKTHFNEQVRISGSQKISLLFSARVVDRWNTLDQEDIDSETVNGFKSKLEKKHYTKTG